MTPDEIIEIIERLAWLADNGERPSRGELANAEAAIKAVEDLSYALSEANACIADSA